MTADCTELGRISSNGAASTSLSTLDTPSGWLPIRASCSKSRVAPAEAQYAEISKQNVAIAAASIPRTVPWIVYGWGNCFSKAPIN